MGTSTKLSTDRNFGFYGKVVTLSENKVFIATSGETSSIGSYYELFGMVCTISETTITAGINVNLSSYQESAKTVSIVVLNKNKVFVAFSDDDIRLYGIVCSVSGVNISTGSRAIIEYSTKSGQCISAVALNENTVLIAHSYSIYYSLNAVVCKISGTNITVGTDTQLSTVQYSGNTISATLLTNNSIIIMHSYGQNLYLNKMVITITDAVITVKTDVQLLNENNVAYRLASVQAAQNKTFVIHSHQNGSDMYMYGFLIGYLSYIEPVTLPTDDIYGVAKDDAINGSMVDVYRPLPEEVVI